MPWHDCCCTTGKDESMGGASGSPIGPAHFAWGSGHELRDGHGDAELSIARN